MQSPTRVFEFHQLSESTDGRAVLFTPETARGSALVATIGDASLGRTVRASQLFVWFRYSAKELDSIRRKNMYKRRRDSRHILVSKRLDSSIVRQLIVILARGRSVIEAAPHLSRVPNESPRLVGNLLVTCVACHPPHTSLVSAAVLYRWRFFVAVDSRAIVD